MMRAGFWLSSTPAMCPPAAQMIAAATSDERPPFQLKARIGKIVAPEATPAIPIPLFV